MLQQLLVGPELLPADGDDGALEELVVVDEEPDLPRALLRRDVKQGGAVAGVGAAEGAAESRIVTFSSKEFFKCVLASKSPPRC